VTSIPADTDILIREDVWVVLPRSSEGARDGSVGDPSRPHRVLTISQIVF
jgi:hypothetical protein